MAPDTIPQRQVTIVLPHRERFGPLAAGAVAMVVQRLAAGPSRYQALVVGPPVGGPGFPGIDFLAVRVPRFLPLTVTQSYAAKLALVLARRPAGLIEVHNKPDVALWLARCFAHRPVTLFLHNDPRSMRGARSPAARARLLRRLARVVTVSAFLRDALLEGVAPPPERPPLVIHNALDPATLPEPVPPQQRDRLILFAGRVVPDKAPDAFVAACAEALPRLPGWRAEIIGADGFGTDRVDSAFIRRLRPAAEAAGIVLHGHLPHAAVLAAMARAAIVVVPSRWPEPFGLAALEAMACGAALVCSGRGGLAEVAGEAALPIDPDDPAAMARALVRLAGDADLRAALSAAGLHRARTRFAAADAVAKLDELRDRLRGVPSSHDVGQR
jgi:glycosyltransferase involved in cell wall biosynthesis